MFHLRFLLGYGTAGKILISGVRFSMRSSRIGETSDIPFTIQRRSSASRRVIVDLRTGFVRVNESKWLWKAQSIQAMQADLAADQKMRERHEKTGLILAGSMRASGQNEEFAAEMQNAGQAGVLYETGCGGRI